MAIPSVATPPLFSRVSSSSWIRATINIGTGVPATALTGTNFLVFVADATNGSYLDRIVFQPLGSQEAIVGRVWINNGLLVADNDNNALLQDVALAKTTDSSTTILGQTVLNMNMALPPAARIFITFTSNVMNGFSVTAIGGPY